MENQTTHSLQSNSPEVPLVGQEKNKNKTLIIAFALLFLTASGTAGYFAYQNHQFKQQSSQTPATSPAPSHSLSPTTAPEKQSELTSLDNTWSLYTNYQLGFSLKIPKISTGDAPCVWKGEDEDDHSYRPVYGPVPVKIFEDEKGIYIDHEYRYKLTGETRDENGRSFFSGCEKEMITLDILQNEKPQTWNIISEKVTNDQELDTFIKRHFNPACRLGEKTPSQQTGVFDVVVEGDGKQPPETKCWLNYAYVVKYSPEKQRTFTWDLGQACSFYYNEHNDCYSMEMQDSFKVL